MRCQMSKRFQTVKKMSRKYQLYVIYPNPLPLPLPHAPTPVICYHTQPHASIPATCPHSLPLQYGHSSCHMPPISPPATCPHPTPHPVKLLEITLKIMQKKFILSTAFFSESIWQFLGKPKMAAPFEAVIWN